MNQNYLVLARKYRPSNFAHLKGQEFLVTTIVNAIKLERVAHTFLLTGIRGGGKTTTARIIAKTLNCSHPVVDEKLVLPCEKCNSCIAVAADNHPDIIELDAASRTGVNDVREIIENTHYMPLLGAYKIYIIDEVHMLSTSAFNALLKTLEEPPAHVKFIFATTELRKIPITILSRCQKFELRRLNSEELIDHLKEILSQENIKADEDALKLIAAHAEGSVRDSLSLLDLVIANANKDKITKDQVKHLLGYSDATQVISLLEYIISGNSKEALSMIKEFYYAGKDLHNILHQLMELVHNITKIKLEAGDYAIEYSDIELEHLNKIAKQMTIVSLTILWQMIFKGIGEIQIAHNQLITAEMIIIRLCHLSNIPTPEVLMEQIKSGKALDKPKDIELSKKIIDKPKIVINGFEELVQLFHQKREMLLYQYLISDVHLIEFEHLKVKIRQTSSVPHNFAGKVAALLQEWTGEKWFIIIASEPGEATLSSQAEQIRLDKVSELEQNDMVKEVMNNFSSAKIKEIQKI